MTSPQTLVPEIRFEGFCDPWKERNLGELVSITTGKLDANAAQKDGKYAFFTCGKETLKTDSYSFDGDAILISGNGDLGFTRKYSGKFDAYQRTYVLQDFATDFEYLEHAVHRYLPERIKSESFGGAMPYIKLDTLTDLGVYIPQIEEAQKVSKFLNNIDDLIALNECRYNRLKDVKKSMLEKMFPRYGADVPEIRFAGFTNAWEQRKLGEVASSFEYGLNAAAKEFDGVNKYLRITDIDDSSRAFKGDDLTSPDTDLTTASNYQLHDGEILFARTGASVGKTFIYRESDGLVYFAGFLIRAKIKPEYDSEFVFQNTLGASYEKYIQVTSQRSGQPGVNAQEYAAYTFLAPDYAEQKKIGGFLDNLITLHQCKCDKLKDLKNSLLQKMFV